MLISVLLLLVGCAIFYLGYANHLFFVQVVGLLLFIVAVVLLVLALSDGGTNEWLLQSTQPFLTLSH